MCLEYVINCIDFYASTYLQSICTYKVVEDARLPLYSRYMILSSMVTLMLQNIFNDLVFMVPVEILLNVC